MKPTIRLISLTALLLAPALLGAAEITELAKPADDWHARTLGEALGLTALFGLVGVALAVAGYKLFDLCTPGNLHKEIIENKNVAASIVAGAVILGVSIIIAAAIIG